MSIEIITKQTNVIEFDKNAVVVKYIEYYGGRAYEEGEITEALIYKILKEIPKGINIYLFLNPDGEDDWLEVNCDGEWISLGFSGNGGQNNYYSYNPAFADTEKQIGEWNYSDKNVWTDLESGGQSPVPKIQAITDIEGAVKAVEYFIYTGKFYPGIDWAHEC